MNRPYFRLLYIIGILGVFGILVTYILGQDYYFSEILKKTGDKLSLFSELSRSVCGSDSSIINCNKVRNSSYSSIFGIPMAFLGMFYFFLMTAGVLSIIFFKERLLVVQSVIMFWFLIFGSTFDLALLFVSIFKINALCSLCVASYLFIWISLALFSLFMVKNGLFSVNVKEAFVENRKTVINRYVPFLVIISVLSAIISYSINGFLQINRDKFIAQYKKAAFEQILREFPNEEKVNINPSRALSSGRSDAPVEIVEFSDFLCPYCSVASTVINNILAEKPDKVKVVFMNYPLDIECNSSMKKQLHAGACLLAKGSISAAMQGKFDEYLNIAFQSKVENPGKSHLEKIARFSGLNVNRFFSDLESQKTANELKSQIDLANKLGITSTPTIFINGRKFKYRPDKDLLEKIIDQEYEAITRESGKSK